MKQIYKNVIKNDKSINSIINEYTFDFDKLEHQVSIRSAMIKLAIHKAIDKYGV